jgi:tRNA (guanine-N7-)-methyltransferase
VGGGQRAQHLRGYQQGFHPLAARGFLAMIIDGSVLSFARRRGRITQAQTRALERFSDRYVLGFRDAPVDYAGLFGNDAPLIIEIGFGMGTATAEIAKKFPRNNFLGIEVFEAGVGKLLSQIESEKPGETKISNIRIVNHDAVEVIKKMIPSDSVAGFHVFFPDPWPKKKHHKRRLIQRPFTDLLADRLKPGGYLYFVTDWDDYAQWALDELTRTAKLRNKFETFAQNISWRPVTKFEKRALAEGREIKELYFERT